jgi:hypothetical protein
MNVIFCDHRLNLHFVASPQTGFSAVPELRKARTPRICRVDEEYSISILLNLIKFYQFFQSYYYHDTLVYITYLHLIHTYIHAYTRKPYVRTFGQREGTHLI